MPETIQGIRGAKITPNSSPQKVYKLAGHRQVGAAREKLVNSTLRGRLQKVLQRESQKSMHSINSVAEQNECREELGVKSEKQQYEFYQ